MVRAQSPIAQSPGPQSPDPEPKSQEPRAQGVTLFGAQVMSMIGDQYTGALNYQYVECALRGWPGVEWMPPAEYPVLKPLAN